MRGLWVWVGVLAAGCGSKNDSSPPAPASAPGAPAAKVAGKHPRINGMITNTEGAELCAALLPDSAKGGDQVTGGGEATRLTCNLKTTAGKLLRSVAMDCKPGQSVDTFKAAAKGADLPGLGRVAVQNSSGPVFFATKADCTVTVYSFDASGDAMAFAKAIDGVLTPSNTPWPEK
jgi:hypothetical protein